MDDNEVISGTGVELKDISRDDGTKGVGVIFTTGDASLSWGITGVVFIPEAYTGKMREKKQKTMIRSDLPDPVDNCMVLI